LELGNKITDHIAMSVIDNGNINQWWHFLLIIK